MNNNNTQIIQEEQLPNFFNVLSAQLPMITNNNSSSSPSTPLPTTDFSIYFTSDTFIPEIIDRQLSSKAWSLAYSLKRPTDPFLVLRRVSAQSKTSSSSKTPQTFVGRLKKFHLVFKLLKSLKIG
jgi:hypothetical protein